MKILVVVPDLDIGGVTSSARNFCNECAKQGNDVNILVMNNAVANIPRVNQTYMSSPSRYWNLGIQNLKKASFIKKFFIAPIAVAKKILNKRGLWLPLILNKKLSDKYDLVVAYRQCAPCYYYSLRCVNASKKIAMIHGDIEFMGEISSWSTYLQQFDKIACVSNAVAKGFKNHFKSISDKFTTIYNMYDIDRMKTLLSEDCKFNLDRSKFNIVSVCRQENGHKKVNRVIEACALLVSKGFTDFQWYIVGDGPDFQHNIQLAESLGVSLYITFCGALSNPFSLLSKCDISVLTSVTEAYGMSLKESMLVGVPTVAMEYPALTEVIKDGSDGLICKQSVEDLCEKLLYLSKNPEVLTRMRAYIAQHPQSNDTAYQQLLNCI